MPADPRRSSLCSAVWLIVAPLVLGATELQASEQGDVTLARGVVRAEASATISSELVARVAAITFKAGQAFRAGDVLLRFDCQRYDADLRAAEAEVRAQEIMVETNRHLLRHKAAGSNELALAEIKHVQARAQADSLRARMTQCQIVAPYEGRVVERHVDVFEIPQPNSPLLRIVKEGALEVELILPSHWTGWLRPGFGFSFEIEETRRSYAARIQHIGAVVDPVSRTMKASASLLDADADVRPGMSGSGRFRLPKGGAP
jgi:RND family efflux transporter MFP subunit